MEFASLPELAQRSGVKWSRPPEGTIAAWVADMDFPVAPAITEAIESYVSAGDFGYANVDHERFAAEALVPWLSKRHEWSPDVDQCQFVGDVMMGVAVAIQTLTEPGDEIILQTPIYPPFPEAVTTAGRVTIENPLRPDWSVDLDGLAAAAPSARMLLLSHPHNPTGRSFSRDELEGIAEIAITHDLIVVSDEIHADLVHAPGTHIPLQTLGGGIAERTITLVSASKAFNIAGIGVGAVVFGSPLLKDRFDELPSWLIGHPRALGLHASIAAWTKGEQWLDEAREVLLANRQTVRNWVDRTDGVETSTPEATYFAWLDFRAWRTDDPAATLLDEARVALSSGLTFGEQGRGFARLNFATSPDVLAELLGRIEAR